MKALDPRIELTMSKPTETKDYFGDKVHCVEVTQEIDGSPHLVADLRHPSIHFVIALGKFICAAPQVLDLVDTHTQMKLDGNSDNDVLTQLHKALNG